MFVGKYKLKMATVVYQQFSISLFFRGIPSGIFACLPIVPGLFTHSYELKRAFTINQIET